MTSTKKVLWLLGAAFAVAICAGVAVIALFLNIHGKQTEARQYPLMLNKVSDDEVSPEKWGRNFPSQYDFYKQMVETDKPTNYGGNLPYSKLLRYPQLPALWAGYTFAADFNEERGHYYAQIDQLETKRNDKEWLNANGFPAFQGQPGACMNCHSGWAPKLIRELGWEAFNKTPYHDLVRKLEKEQGPGIYGAKLGGTCADCHSPDDMSLRVTRPAYIKAMVGRGYTEDPKQGIKATRQEMRSHVCEQCHVEYYFQKGTNELVLPWKMWPEGQPLKIEMIEAHYDAARNREDGFKQDWVHKLSGASMIKIQHPEAELFSSGIHARSGVACADCHMPYQRVGALKISNHKISSPLFNINGSCQTCHTQSETEIRERVDYIQRNTAEALRRSEEAILALVDDLKNARASLEETEAFRAKAAKEEQDLYTASVLDAAREYHRRASLRWDFIFSENSTGFHSPQGAARTLAQAMELARRGQLELVNALRREGVSIEATTGPGPIPERGKPIPEHKPPVGQMPPDELLKVDEAAL